MAHPAVVNGSLFYFTPVGVLRSSFHTTVGTPLPLSCHYPGILYHTSTPICYLHTLEIPVNHDS